MEEPKTIEEIVFDLFFNGSSYGRDDQETIPEKAMDQAKQAILRYVADRYIGEDESPGHAVRDMLRAEQRAKLKEDGLEETTKEDADGTS